MYILYIYFIYNFKLIKNHILIYIADKEIKLLKLHYYQYSKCYRTVFIIFIINILFSISNLTYIFLSCIKAMGRILINIYSNFAINS